jgi:hypothetical protein
MREVASDLWIFDDIDLRLKRISDEVRYTLNRSYESNKFWQQNKLSTRLSEASFVCP